MSVKTVAPAAGLMLLVVAAYLPATRAGFIWDDDQYVEDNATLRSADGLRRMWLEPDATPQYYPLVFTTFWVEHSYWGTQPRGYHVVNVLLHGGAAVLLWQVLRRLAVPGAWFAAALFALHPVQVESVAWVTERKNVLSGLLYFAAFLAYLRFSPPDEILPPSAGRWGWYALAFVLFLGALLSKTVTCSLPAVLVLVLWWKRGRLAVRDWVGLPPLFAAGAGLALVTVWVEKHHVGAQGQDWSLTPVDRVLIAGRALWFYAGKLVWPVDLTFIYPRWSIDLKVWWQYLFPAAAVVVVGLLWLARNRLGKGPLVAVLVFAGTLVPALGFFDVYPMRYSFVADHFQYLASAGLITLATAVAAQWLQWSGPAGRWLGPAVGGGVLLILGTLSWRQEQAYRDAPTLWRDTLRKNPDCWMAHYNLGKVFLKQDQVDDAVEQFNLALASNPRLVEAECILVEAALKQGDLEAARRHLANALAINPNHRQVAISHLNLGVALKTLGKSEEAMTQFRAALAVNPRYVLARYYLGVTLAEQKQWDEAVEQLNTALEVPSDLAPEIHNELGRVFAQQERWPEAVANYRVAVRLQPRVALYHHNLGVALQGLGDTERANAEFREAQRLQQAGQIRPPHP